MEAVLDVYHRPYDARFPVICMDELSVQLIQEKRQPLPLISGQAAHYDCEYIRHGTANLFVVTEPLGGWRHMEVTPHRRKKDWAEVMDQLSDQYPDAKQITVVLDNLNTHHPSSFYDTFEPSKARRLTQRFEFVYTPKHGSWLNIAEIEFNVVNQNCLSRRIPDMDTLRTEVAAWEARRNESVKGVDWQFTTDDARTKLKRLYPKNQI